MPVTFGVLTTNTAEEALARAGDGAVEQGTRGRARGARDGAAVCPTRRVTAAPSPRHRAREAALQVLYLWEIGGVTPERGDRRRISASTRPTPSERGPRTFATTLVHGTVADLAGARRAHRAHAQHWRLERLAVIDRLILRMAVWELRHEPDTPPAVVINEAIELARTSAPTSRCRFVNGVLDAIRKSLRHEA